MYMDQAELNLLNPRRGRNMIINVPGQCGVTSLCAADMSHHSTPHIVTFLDIITENQAQLIRYITTGLTLPPSSPWTTPIQELFLSMHPIHVGVWTCCIKILTDLLCSWEFSLLHICIIHFQNSNHWEVALLKVCVSVSVCGRLRGQQENSSGWPAKK